jgi:hypothetical protein
MNYYSLDYPIVYKQDKLGQLNELTFLSSIPLRGRHSLTGIGLEFDIPLKHTIKESSLWYNGQRLFSIKSKENMLYKAIIYCHTIYTYYSQVNKWLSEEERIECYIELVNAIERYLDLINLDDILSDLNVNVYGHYRCKIGDDDTYTVYRTASLSSPVAKNDMYLKSLIGVGTKEIDKDSGYTSQLVRYSKEYLSSKGISFGNYSGNVIEKEKERIKSMYSRQTHFAYLLYCHELDIKYEKLSARGLIGLEENFKNFLEEGFHISFFDKNKEIERMTYPLEHIHETTKAQAVVDGINLYIRENMP